MASSKIHNLHFLLVPLMTQSHIIPITDFAKLLAQRGVLVSIITTPLNAIRYKSTVDQAKAQNLRIQMIPINFPSKEVGLPQGCENLEDIKSPELAMKFLQASELLQSPIEKVLEEMKPRANCIISSNAVPWTQKVAEKLEIPRYIFDTISCFVTICDHNLFKGKVQENTVSDFEPFLVPGIPHEIEFTNAQLPARGSSSNSIRSQIKLAQILARGSLVNTFEELEPWYLEACRKELGKVWCIGPVSQCNKGFDEKSRRGNKPTIDEQYCIEWLDSKNPRSTIYACFGSLCRISSGQIKEIGLGLEESNFPFIWIIRKQDYSPDVEKWFKEEGFNERVKDRGLIIRGWAPQVLILSHLSIGGFLTHCGWNSTLEGVCAGVPMITWPMFSEQFYNEKYIVKVLGIGVQVGVEASTGCKEQSRTFIKKEQLRISIEKLMDESEEGTKRRIRAGELATLACNVMEEEGSSYLNLTMLIQDVMQQFE